MKITFDKNVYALIKDKILKDISYLRNRPDELQKYEFEVRFGELNKTFKPFITDEVATKLKKLFSDKNIPQKYSESKVEIFKDKIRRITIDKLVRFEKKETLLNKSDHKDITTFEYKDFAIRFGYAKEENIVINDVSKLGDVLETRNRKRYEYETPNYTYSITYVADHIEFEIEYKLTPQLLQYQQYQSPLQTYVEQSIQFVLPYMVIDQEVITYMPTGKQDFIRKAYINIVKMSKPINIERQHIIKIKKEPYTVTNKLDGERFYIVFNKFGIYALNHNIVDELMTFRDSRYTKISMIDCERYRGKFYVFDCMIYNDEQITSYPHSKRLEYAAMLIKPYSFMKMKIFDQIDQTEKLLKELKESKEENDGLIFTPDKDEYNSKFIFKWKFPEKMSIDFRVKYNTNLETGGYLYHLFSYDSSKEPVPFMGTKNFPLADAIFVSDDLLLDGKIYEFTYDNESDKFVLLRLRPDKIQPNFITVAQNVWNDIKNPFTEDELIKLLYHTSDDDLLAMKVVNPLEEYRKHHNMAKREIISKYCAGKNILDLGFGRGGDLSKYNDVSVSHIWGIEPNQSNIDECKKRLYQTYTTMLHKTYVISGQAQDTSRIKTFIAFPPTYVSPIYDRIFKQSDPLTWFPISASKNVNYKELMFTEEGKYSVTKSPISNAFIRIMDEIFSKRLDTLTITDATSNIGGDTIKFGLHFKNVVGVEINPENFKALQHNVGVYGLKNVELIQDSSFRLWNSDNFPRTNLLFIDPPWGGVDYDKETAIDIFLYEGDQKIPLDVVLSNLREMPSHGIFLKLPYNYMAEKLLTIKGVNDVRFYSIGKILFAYLDTRKTTPYTIDKSLKTKKIDVISSFFSLSFFFFDPSDLNKLVRTISSTLKPGGWFVGTTIDGNRTKRLLDMSNGEFVFNGGHIRWGDQNTVNIFMKDSIMGDQTESLVDFDKLAEELKKHDIVLRETQFIDENPLLTPTTQTLNSLYRKFAFQKLSSNDVYLSYAERLVRLVSEKPECFSMFLRLCTMPDEVDVDHPFSFSLRFPGNVTNQFDGVMSSSDHYKKMQRISEILPSAFMFKRYDGIKVSSTTYFVIKPRQVSMPIIDIFKQLTSADEVYELLLQCLAIVYTLERHNIYVDYKQFLCIQNAQNQPNNVNINDIIIKINKFIVKIPETIVFLQKPYVIMDDNEGVNLNSLLNRIFQKGRVNETLVRLRDVMSLKFDVSDIRMHTERSAIGMPNIGNTCYFNSSIQSIASLPQLVDYFRSDKNIHTNKKAITKGKLVQAFIELINQFISNRGSIVDKKYVVALRRVLNLFNPLFGHNNFSQQDADEFVSTLLQALHAELNTKDGIEPRYVYKSEFSMDDNIQQALDLYFAHNDSIISRLFTILQKITIRCQVCGNERSYIEPTYTCNVVLPRMSSARDEVDLQQLLDNYKITELLSDPVYCDKCSAGLSKMKKTNHTKITENIYFSPIVKITLLRFKNHLEKNNIMVDFPFAIQLSDKSYSLNSVINHMGGTSGGHYTSYGKIGDEWHEWHEFNDSGVSLVEDEDDVRSRNGYILFYSES
jgi:ubiquitin C-terminal hydrolase